MWGSASASEWGEGNPTSGPGSSEGRSSLVPWFSRLLLLDVPGTATEQVRTCGFKRNSSSFDKAPKMRDSVLLNSIESFLVTLPSISSETWEIYSWVSSGSRMFCVLPILALSGFLLKLRLISFYFSTLPSSLGKRFYQRWRLNFYFIFLNTVKLLFLIWGENLLSTNSQMLIIV